VPALAGVAFLRQFVTSSTFAVSMLWAAGGACTVRGANAPGTNIERQSEAEYDLARDHFYKEQPRQALDHVRRAIDLDSENANALYFAATIHLYFCSGRLELSDPDCRLNDAETYAHKALQVNERFREARNTLGQIYILEKKYPEAIRILEPLTKDPAFESSFLAWGNLGWAQVLAGHLDQGIESLKSSITEPRFCVGHYRLGVAYEKKGDLGAAEASLTNAVSVDAPQCKNLQDAWEERARVRMQLGKLADARADFEKCRDIAADSRAGKACVEALGRIQ
jgi:type IV pilus assembly protein PilF